MKPFHGMTTGERAQVRSRSSSLGFSPNQGNDYFTIQSPHDSPEPDDYPVIYPSEHQLPALDPIAAAQHPQPSDIPSDQEREEFSAIKKLLPSDSVPAAFHESAAVHQSIYMPSRPVYFIITRMTTVPAK